MGLVTASCGIQVICITFGDKEGYKIKLILNVNWGVILMLKVHGKQITDWWYKAVRKYTQHNL